MLNPNRNDYGKHVLGPALPILSPLIGPAGSASEAPAESIRHILKAVRLHLGMDVAFVSEFVGDRRVFRYIDAAQEEEAPVRVGDSGPLDESYCQRVINGRLPELIPDTAAVPAAMEMPVTRALPVGAHLSVPMRLKDGTLFGTFCCFSSAADPTLNERDLNVVRAFAEIASHQIELSLKENHERETVSVRVRRAIQECQLSTAYQPICRVENGTIGGVECLARFSASPSRSPDVWFAEAAEVGLGVQLELKAIQVALAGLASLPSVYLGLNVSPATILSGQIGKALESVPGQRVLLELTEHARIADYGEVCHALRPLRERGVRLAVDDAGAGYAGLRHILNLEPDVIKLDMTLTRDIDKDPARRALASALIGFGRATGSQIVAEGVETASELDALKGLGVEAAQGYHLGRPMPLAQIGELLRRQWSG